MARIHVYGAVVRDLVSFVHALPLPGETIFAERHADFPGGKGANQAVAAARLGGDVKLVATIGRDGYGAAMRDFLAGEGLDLGDLTVTDAAPTGLGLVTVDASSQNAIVVVPGANLVWDAEAVPVDAIQPGDFVVGQFEIPLAITTRAFQAAKQRGATTILNPAPGGPIEPALMGAVDILVLNETELEIVGGAPLNFSDFAAIGQAAEALRQRGPGIVIATLGANGAVACAGGAMQRIEGYRVEAVDTTGAGDCFIGAMAASLARGAGIQEAAVFANRAASISVTRLGAGSSLPRLDEL